jgi:hypothetical protein
MRPAAELPPGRCIIEAKIKGEWRRIAACSNPLFMGDVMCLEGVVIAQRPEFTIRPIGIEDWLKKKLLIVTLIRETETSRSTTSWACTYMGATGVAELEEVCALTGVTMKL